MDYTDFESTLYYAGVLGKSSNNLITKKEITYHYSESLKKSVFYYDYELDKSGYVLKEKMKLESTDVWYVMNGYTYN